MNNNVNNNFDHQVIDIYNECQTYHYKDVLIVLLEKIT